MSDDASEWLHGIRDRVNALLAMADSIKQDLDSDTAKVTLLYILVELHALKKMIDTPPEGTKCSSPAITGCMMVQTLVDAVPWPQVDYTDFDAFDLLEWITPQLPRDPRHFAGLSA